MSNFKGNQNLLLEEIGHRGREEIEVNNSMNVHPSPHVLNLLEEQMIIKAKNDLGISHDLDNFQV